MKKMAHLAYGAFIRKVWILCNSRAEFVSPAGGEGAFESLERDNINVPLIGAITF